jgi:hypothetical protein
LLEAGGLLVVEEPLFLSSAVVGLLAGLEGTDPTGRRSYPPVADKPTVRMSDGETLHQWFTRCVNAFAAKNWPLERWEAAPDLAIMALVEWGEPGKELNGCSVQVVKTEGALSDYLVDDKITSYYFRFDWDYGTLGPLFTHPLPHVHAWKEDDAPRFVCEGDGCNVIVDFLEWIFRHFYHDDWLLWATDVCEVEFDRRFGKEKNPLDRIFRAFKESKITVLRQYPNEISEVKRMLRERKDKAYRLRVSLADRDLLKYP